MASDRRDGLYGLAWQCECLVATKLENNPMAGLYNVSENFWVGKVRNWPYS